MLIPLMLSLALISETRPLIIYQTREPLSVCDGSLSALAQKAKQAQPANYVDPKDFGTDTAAYLAHPRPTALFDKTGTPWVEITRLKEIPFTYLLLFSERSIMNYALNRASAAIEGNTYMSDGELLNDDALTKIAGHDLQSPGLAAMHELMLAGKSFPTLKQFSSDDLVRLSVEHQFWKEWLLSKLELHAKEPFVIISSLVHSNITQRVVGHEALHARFFQEPLVTLAAIDFYRGEVTPEDKEIYLTALQSYDNIRNDPVLAANEFFAYIQEPEAYESLKNSRFPEMRPLADLVLKYQDRMRAFMKVRGITLYDFKLEVH